MADQELTAEEAAAFGLTPSGPPQLTNMEAKAAGIRDKHGKGETGVLHGAQGVLAGFLDDLTGAVGVGLASKPGRWLREKTGVLPLNPDGTDPLKAGADVDVKNGPKDVSATAAFKPTRDSVRQDLKETAEDHPVIATGAEILGAVASPVGKLAPGAGVTAKLLPKATGLAGRLGAKAAGSAVDAAAQGAIGGLGYSEATNAADLAKDVGVSAGMGGAFGAATGGILGAAGELADTAYIREVVGARPKPSAAPEPAAAASRTAMTLATDGPPATPMAFERSAAAAPTSVDNVLPASIAPETPTQFERPPAKTEIGAMSEPDNWHDFLKGRIGPAMAANGNNAAKAIKELSEDWKALQRGQRRAPTIVEPATMLEGPPVDMPDPTEARTVFNPMAKTAPDISAAKDRAAARAPRAEIAPTELDITKPEPSVSKTELPKVAESKLPTKSEGPSREQILDAGYRKNALKDREELKRLIVAEISEGSDGIRPTATAVKKLDKADDAIAAEVIDGPDKKVVREAYLGRAKPGRDKLGKVINDVDSQNEKLYAEFTKAGRSTVDHDAYRAALAAAAKRANKAGSPMDTALLDQLITRFDDMVTRNEGAPVTLSQLRGWTTEVQGLAASAIGGMNEHTTAALKSRAARIVTAEMDGVMGRAAAGDAKLQAAARQIAVNNRRLHGLLTIDEALARRQPKEQASKTIGQRAAEVVTTGAVGAGIGALTDDDNAGRNALAGGLAGALIGSRGQAANAVGRRVQRGVTTKAIQSAENAARGRIATEAAEAARLNPVSRATVSAGRSVGEGSPEDLSVLTQDELNREIAISAGNPLSGERYRRAIRELQSRSQ